MKTILLAASTAMLAIAAPAFAQDTAAPASDNGSSFAGPRAEIFGGYDYTRTHQRNELTGEHSRNHHDGVTAGGLLGYDFPLGDRFVAGPFASFAETSTKNCIGQVGCIKSDRQIEAGGRIGAKMGDRALLYAKGAYVNGQFREHVVQGEGTPDENYVVGRANRDGWRAGAGIEYALTKHAYVKGEVDYTRFSSFSLANLDQDPARVRFDRGEALGGFGVRF